MVEAVVSMQRRYSKVERGLTEQGAAGTDNAEVCKPLCCRVELSPCLLLLSTAEEMIPKT